MHGNKSQSQRERILKAFRSAAIDILIATDIAARGIDIDGIEHVINYDLPDAPEAYVHRIGRTARAGASGCATSLCSGAERKQLREIEKLTRQPIKSEVHSDGITETETSTALAAQPAPGKSAPKTTPLVAAKSGTNGHWWERATPKAQRGRPSPRGRLGSPRGRASAAASWTPA
jgi:ATP-dependent RNA helicase RhlE